MKIPMKKKFSLKYGPMTLRYDEEINGNFEALNALGVDCPETVREILRERLPQVLEAKRRELQQSA